MIRRFAPLVVAPFLAVSAHAGAKLLVSPPVAHEAGGIMCSIANAGPKAITLADLQISGAAGTGSLIPEPVVLEPGQFYAKSNYETIGYCRFLVEGSTKGVRASACRWEGGQGAIGTSFDCVEAY